MIILLVYESRPLQSAVQIGDGNFSDKLVFVLRFYMSYLVSLQYMLQWKICFHKQLTVTIPQHQWKLSTYLNKEIFQIDVMSLVSLKKKKKLKKGQRTGCGEKKEQEKKSFLPCSQALFLCKPCQTTCENNLRTSHIFIWEMTDLQFCSVCGACGEGMLHCGADNRTKETKDS